MYEQKMCYIDLYRNSVKCGNMGHVRMEWDEDRYRFGASLCHMDRQTLVTAILERTGGRPRTTIQNIAIIHGRGNAQLDWMPIEGNEESLLFLASGEIYGVCRLPKMREMPQKESAETEKAERQAEGESERPGSQSRLPEGESERPGSRSRLPEGNNQEPETQQAAEKKGGMLEAVLRTMEKQSGTQKVVPEAASSPTVINPTVERGGMPKAAAGGKEPGTVREQERQGGAQETVVLPYPVGVEERRRRERHAANLSDDKWKQLCSIYPTVHPIGDDVEFIRITPADFVVLRQEYQNLVRNSFLLHGYYNYEHVLLGKYPDKYYIGVPGIMHEQERIAAAMFGFVGFERAEAPKEQKDNRDSFGYYMMEVGI